MITYCTYKNYLAKYDDESYTLTFVHTPTGASASLVIDGLYFEGEKAVSMSDYSHCSASHSFDPESPERRVMLTFHPNGENTDIPTFQISIDATSKWIRVMFHELNQYRIVLNGQIVNGSADESFALNSKETPSEVIRCAIGPAVSLYDNALYNKILDSICCIEGCRDFKLRYDWNEKSYKFTMSTVTEGIAETIYFKVKENALADKYDIDFVPLKKRGRYETLPSGWMTWYAVKFGASEEKVLENARFQAEHLKPFGADTVWVDWEWYHKKYEKERFDGVNCFNPDPNKYPNGLGYLAEEIKKLGFVPAVWIGFTNDPSLTDYEKEHPEISLAHFETWSGKYYYDATNPEYLNGFLPKAVEQVKEWGYEAVKFDTLPNAVMAHERFHENMTHPELTTHEAFKGMISKTRELLGEDFYVLSCGSYISSVLWSAGVFDAARVGPDLFTWAGFVKTVSRLRYYYPLHNLALINDPDNIVLREEYSNFNQAVSRVSLVALLGLPVTFGDDLPTLPTERVDLLKRALPVMKVHPTDFNKALSDGKTQLICQRVALPFEEYLVAGVMNLTDENITRDVSFREALRLEDGKYLVYDYFRDKFLGIVSDRFEMELEAFETRVLCFRAVLDRPQIVSTSRHLSQGAAELVDVNWENCILTVIADLVKDDEYRMTLYVPSGFKINELNAGKLVQEGNIATVSFTPELSGTYEFIIKF